MSEEAFDGAEDIGEDHEAEPEIDEADEIEAGGEVDESEGDAAAEATGAEDTGERDEDTGERIFTIKVDGEERGVPESKLIELAQKGFSSGRRFQQAAEMQRHAKSTLDRFQADPTAFLAEQGEEAVEKALYSLVNSDNPTAQRAVEKAFRTLLAEQQMTPDQRRMRDLERDSQRLKELEQEREKKAQEEQLQAEAERAQQEFTTQFQGALEASGVPVTPYTMGRMAYYTEAAIDRGVNISAEQIAAKVREEQQAELRDMVGRLKPADLEKILGKDIARALREAEVEKVQGHPGRQRPAKSRGGAAPARRREPQYIDAESFFSSLPGAD